MSNKFMDAVMNPVRTRIVQYLMLHEKGTVGEIKKDLSDVPPASLYRHIKVLLDANCIMVADERPIRGTVERIYQLNPNPMGDYTEAKVEDMIQNGLYSIMGDFHRYFAKENHNPEKDMICFRTSTLMLTDEEFVEFFNKLGVVFQEALEKGAREGRKQRKLTVISLPEE